jgi:hypothetical protein
MKLLWNKSRVVSSIAVKTLSMQQKGIQFIQDKSNFLMKKHLFVERFKSKSALQALRHQEIYDGTDTDRFALSSSPNTVRLKY